MEVDDVEDFQVKGEENAQHRDPRIVGACAIEMHLANCAGATGKAPAPETATQTLRKPAHLKCMQEISQEPLCAKLCKKNAGAQNRDADFEPAQAKFTGHLTRATAWQNLREKFRSPKPRRRPAQSTFHSSHLAPEFTRKMPEPNTAMQTF